MRHEKKFIRLMGPETCVTQSTGCGQPTPSESNVCISKATPGDVPGGRNEKRSKSMLPSRNNDHKTFLRGEKQNGLRNTMQQNE